MTGNMLMWLTIAILFELFLKGTNSRRFCDKKDNCKNDNFKGLLYLQQEKEEHFDEISGAVLECIIKNREELKSVLDALLTIKPLLDDDFECTPNLIPSKNFGSLNQTEQEKEEKELANELYDLTKNISQCITRNNFNLISNKLNYTGKPKNTNNTLLGYQGTYKRNTNDFVLSGKQKRNRLETPTFILTAENNSSYIKHRDSKSAHYKDVPEANRTKFKTKEFELNLNTPVVNTSLDFQYIANTGKSENLSITENDSNHENELTEVNNYTNFIAKDDSVDGYLNRNITSKITSNNQGSSYSSNHTGNNNNINGMNEQNKTEITNNKQIRTEINRFSSVNESKNITDTIELETNKGEIEEHDDIYTDLSENNKKSIETDENRINLSLPLNELVNLEFQTTNDENNSKEKRNSTTLSESIETKASDIILEQQDNETKTFLQNAKNDSTLNNESNRTSLEANENYPLITNNGEKKSNNGNKNNTKLETDETEVNKATKNLAWSKNIDKINEDKSVNLSEQNHTLKETHENTQEKLQNYNSLLADSKYNTFNDENVQEECYICAEPIGFFANDLANKDSANNVHDPKRNPCKQHHLPIQVPCSGIRTQFNKNPKFPQQNDDFSTSLAIDRYHKNQMVENPNGNDWYLPKYKNSKILRESNSFQSPISEFNEHFYTNDEIEIL